MAPTALFPLSLGTSSFRTLRRCGEIYVDKTHLVHQLAQYRSKIFLSRPRRFGKSLLVSTFESLFRDGLKDFQGLSIASLWKDTTYRVVRLDFSEIKSFSSPEDFSQKLTQYLIAQFDFPELSSCTNLDVCLNHLGPWMDSLEPSSLVVLIDEYDAPLVNCFENHDLFTSVRGSMSSFFSRLKAREGCLRFFFMTGITKLSNAGIFSEFNNLEDISLSPNYGTLLGYTECEIRENFSEHIRRASQLLQITENQVLDRMRAFYDGFSFDKNARTHVFCPWSVLSFLKNPDNGFDNYWFQSGGTPQILLSYLARHRLSSLESFEEPVSLDLNDLSTSRHDDDISPAALFTMTGYLTIKTAPVGNSVQVGYPNLEVERSMQLLRAQEMLLPVNREKSGLLVLARKLAQGSLDEAMSIINGIFNAIDYQNYPIVNESSCRSHLQLVLLAAGLHPSVETHWALGRSDLDVSADHCRWVFELKFARDDKEINSLLQAGSEQMLSRRYGLSGQNERLY